MIATVELHTGRWCLMVGGWVIAMEGDPCREYALSGDHWTKQKLRATATRINLASAAVQNVVIHNNRLRDWIQDEHGWTATCDWGDCEGESVGYRRASMIDSWLPVCRVHLDEAAGDMMIDLSRPETSDRSTEED